MKARIDSTKCSGYGACADICPSVFVIDEFGFGSLVSDGTVPPGDKAKATEAATTCPENAITVQA